MQSKFDVTRFDWYGSNVLLKPLREEAVNGLVKPEQYDDKSEFGEIIKVGTRASTVEEPLHVGDVIFYGKYSTEGVRVGGVDYLIIHAEDVKSVLHASNCKAVPAHTKTKATAQ